MQTWISASMVAIGLALMSYMIVVEDEPGALPLALVLGGAIWLAVTRLRLRRTRASR